MSLLIKEYLSPIEDSIKGQLTTCRKQSQPWKVFQAVVLNPDWRNKGLTLPCKPLSSHEYAPHGFVKLNITQDSDEALAVAVPLKALSDALSLNESAIENASQEKSLEWLVLSTCFKNGIGNTDERCSVHQRRVMNSVQQFVKRRHGLYPDYAQKKTEYFNAMKVMFKYIDAHLDDFRRSNEPLYVKGTSHNLPYSLLYFPETEDGEKLYISHCFIGRGAFKSVYGATEYFSAEDWALGEEYCGTGAGYRTLSEAETEGKFGCTWLGAQNYHYGRLEMQEGKHETTCFYVTHFERYCNEEFVKKILVEKSSQQKECYILSLLAELNHMHIMGIAHRDIKPENMSYSETTISLRDFGGCYSAEEEYCVASAGNYCAPELRQKYLFGQAHLPETDRQKSDVWGLGVCIAHLLGQPLDNKGLLILNPQEAQDVYRGKMSFLLQNMLNPDPEQRWSSQASYDYFVTSFL